MSWLSSGIKAIGHAAGKVLSNPIVQGASAFIPGVGPLITAGEGALGGLLKPGGNLGQAIGGGLQGAAAGALGGGIKRLGSGVLQNGIGATLSGGLHPTGTFGRTSTMGADQTGGYGNIIDYDAGGNPIYADGGNSGGGGWLQNAVKVLGIGGNGPGGLDLGKLAMGGLAGYQAVNAAQASKRAGQYQDKALAQAEQNYAAGAPLRAQGMQTLLNPQRPDLSATFANPANPFFTPGVKPLGRA